MNDDESTLSAAEARALECVLDEIVPPCEERALPGAGALGGVRYIQRALLQAPDLRPAVVQGLAELQRLATARGAEDFAAVPSSERRAMLDELATTQPAFLPGLIFHTYVGYYQEPRVLEALGIEPRPPFPKGYDMQPGDLGRLDAVRRRPPMYREP